MVNMKANPFYLSDEDCKWVEDTIANMTLDEKIGQLFFNMGSSRDEEYLKMTVEKYHIGGIRYNPATAAEVHEQNRILQATSGSAFYLRRWIHAINSRRALLPKKSRQGKPLHRAMTSVPAPMRRQPITDLGVNFSWRNTAAITSVMTTLNLSMGTTLDTWPIWMAR